MTYKLELRRAAIRTLIIIDHDKSTYSNYIDNNAEAHEGKGWDVAQWQRFYDQQIDKQRKHYLKKSLARGEQIRQLIDDFIADGHEWRYFSMRDRPPPPHPVIERINQLWRDCRYLVWSARRDFRIYWGDQVKRKLLAELSLCNVLGCAR